MAVSDAHRLNLFAGGDTTPTLEDLVLAAAPGTLDVRLAPRGVDVELRTPVVFDQHEIDAIDSGALVLGVGLDSGGERALSCLEAIAERGATAVVFKSTRPVDARLLDAAVPLGAAVLFLNPDVRWGQFLALALALPEALTAPRGRELATSADTDLFGLAEAIALMVGGSVVIEDQGGQLLAYSCLDFPIDRIREDMIIRRKVPQAWFADVPERQILHQLWGTDTVVRMNLPVKGSPVRYASAVRVGEAILGSIWVAPGGSPLADSAEAAIGQCARIVAIHLLRRQLAHTMQRRAAGGWFRSMLLGAAPESVANAPRFTLPKGRGFAVIALSVQDGDLASAALARERALNMISLQMDADRRDALVGLIDDKIYAVIPTSLGDHREAISIASTTGETLRARLRMRVLVGIGSTVPTVSDLPVSRQEADAVVNLLSSDARQPRVGHIRAYRGEVLLRRVSADIAGVPTLAWEQVDELRSHDRHHGTFYEDTLTAYFAAFGDVKRAATALNVHPNTLRYRLRRIKEISRLDLADPSQRLALELYLKASGAAPSRGRSD